MSSADIPKSRYSYEPGRSIYRDGKPYITIQREHGSLSDTFYSTPSEIDDLTRAIVAALNAGLISRFDESGAAWFKPH